MQARFKRKEAGQSIPIIALIIVVLFGMVGLSVDVGNTYAEQRSLVRATNAAALAGMNKLIAGGDDQNIASTIRSSLESNGIQVATTVDGMAQSGQRRMEAHYYGPNGRLLSPCRIGSCGTVPAGVSYIQVTANGLVDTYFARVVGRNTLPVDANAWSAQCLPINGVYPIAIRNSDLNATGFVVPVGASSDPKDPNGVPHGEYTDLNYPDKLTWQRVFLDDTGARDSSFSFLRWNSSGYRDSDAAKSALSDDGTLGKVKFEEVTPWPDSKTTPPANYPLAPNQMSLGDWIHGDADLNWSVVGPALNTLSANKTAVILPIIDGYVGSDDTSARHLARLGRFYILQTGVQGATNYIDLVYLGPVNGTACLQTNVEPIAPSTPPLSVTGAVFVKPRWKTANPYNPVSYQIVLDVSGSMSLDYYGAGTRSATVNIKGDSVGGTNKWCDNWDNPNAPASVRALPIDKECKPGYDTLWWKYQERRAFVAKNAIRTLISQMDVSNGDVMRIIAFTTSGTNGDAKVYPNNGWTADPTILNKAVDDAGATRGDPYRTTGGTPGADGLNKTRTILASSSKPSTSPLNGKPYKNVVIYITDGMSNYFLHGEANYARDIASCKAMGDLPALATPYCQIGVSSDGRLRPITAMIDEAAKMKTADPSLSIYTIAIADANATGLAQVASGNSQAYLSKTPDSLANILLEIKADIGRPCIEAGATGAQYVDNIPAANVANFVGSTSLPANTYGYVYLYDEHQKPLPGNLAQVPIVADITGKLSWSLPEGAGLTPGTYIAKAFVGYKGPDGVSRSYDAITDQSTLKTGDTMSFEVSYSKVLGDQLLIEPIYLDLAGDVCAS